MRYWLLGRQYFVASAAMEFAAKFHTGTRKDNVTPEFDHQLTIAQVTRTYADRLTYPEETLATTFLHDTSEDYDVGFDELKVKFGERISEATKLLTKKYRGSKIPPQVYYGGIAEHEIASVVKGIDRVTNIQTMTGVFSLEKQQAYLDETKTLVLPMLKTARRKFQRQEEIYQNIKFILQSQIQLIEAIHEASKSKELKL